MAIKGGDYVNFNGSKVRVMHAFSDGDLDLYGIHGYVHRSRVTPWKDVVKQKKTKTIGILQLGLLKAKLAVPSGVTLNSKEAGYVIDGWVSEQEEVKSKQSSLVKTSDKIVKHLAQVEQEIPEAIKKLKEAKLNFQKCKTLPAKQKWARKVVIRDAYYQQARNSHHALNSTVERIKDAIDDAQYVHKTIDLRIAEARIYQELNGGLKLVGKALQEARTKHMLPEVEYSKLELSMESIEASVSQQGDSETLQEAERIVNDTARWSSDNDEQAKNNKTKTSKRGKAES